MKCEYALKNMYSDSISVKLSKKIDDHITLCASCRAEVTATSGIGEFLENIKPAPKSEAVWMEISGDIKRHRDERLKKWWRPIFDLMPVDPSNKRYVLIGAACCLMILMLMPAFVSNVYKERQAAEENLEDIEFYLNEHSIAQDADFFRIGAFSEVLLASVESQNEELPTHKN